MRGLLAIDDFDQKKLSQNHWLFSGTRLYLLASGEWLELKRDGHGSAHQGSSDQWSCGDGIIDIPGEAGDDDGNGGRITFLTDEQVAVRYDLADIVKTLAESLATMNQKLPARYTKLASQLLFAQQLLAALTNKA